MIELFPDLYRFTLGKKGLSHAYLLVRPQGNLLVCHANRGSSVTDFLDEVEDLGGIRLQLVAEYANAARGGLHEQLYERFGCPLACPERDRRKIEKKTACPLDPFGGEGLVLDDDFRAFDLGHTVFHWRHVDRHYLIPGHAIEPEGDDGWHLHTHAVHDLRGPLTALVDLPVDLLLPGRSTAGDADVYAFTECSRQTYREALREAMKPARKTLQARLCDGDAIDAATLPTERPRLISNYISPHLKDVIDELALFDTHIMPGGATGKIDILVNSLELADVFFFHDFKREFGPRNPFWDQVRAHVERGGTLLISDARRMVNERQIAGGHPFPEVCQWGGVGADPTATGVTVCGGHPAIGEAEPEACFQSDFTHGTTLEPGEAGSVLARTDAGRPVAVAGEVGKGRIVCACFYYHPHRDPLAGTERQLVQGMFRWLQPA